MKFEVTPEQHQKIQAWLRSEIWPKEVEKQLGTEFEQFHMKIDGHTAPYTGAIGGELEYCFFPTSLGDVLKVKHHSGLELDVTEYDHW